jgi:hypothetical protein
MKRKKGDEIEEVKEVKRTKTCMHPRNRYLTSPPDFSILKDAEPSLNP